MASLAKVPADTARNLASEARQAGIRAGVIAFIALTVGGVVKHASGVLAIGLTVGGLLVAVVFSITAIRANRLRRGLPEEARRVVVVGWTRAPDGSNYAIFSPGADTVSADPELVLKLAGARDVGSGKAILVGSNGPKGAAALVDAAGTVLAVGGFRSPANATKVWARRHDATPWWAGAASRKAPSAPRTRR
jgi:hypothetical protein